ncbi:MAG TPA: formate dehydrogenase accessory sulfurtransferase FdhD [Acidimicrobiales bacterium]|nr:formate dehydrogenase accessory sulfurtransferase FdhD [Acidimicrobiales bacterium]
MARGRTEQVLVRRGLRGVGPDDVIVEEPLEIRLDGRLVTTTMRTPGHDFELATGFLHADGLLGGAAVRQVRYCATGSAVDTEFNVVEVGTDGAAPTPAPRLVGGTSACGLCGSLAIDALTERLVPLAAPAALDSDVLAGLPARVRPLQALFAATGSVHAAASFDPRTGEVGVVREDIGRHNAVDKVVGRLLLDGLLPAAGAGLFVSGRASFEMVQKAWAAGFGLVAAVSGPSSLAVATARRANITLVGFLRDGGMNVYSPAPL